MIDPRYGTFSCFCGEQFQDLVKLDEPVYNEETGEWEDAYYWDQDASGIKMWDHWYEVHDKDRDGVLDE